MRRPPAAYNARLDRRARIERGIASSRRRRWMRARIDARRRARRRDSTTRAIDGRGACVVVGRTCSLHAVVFPHAMVEACVCDDRVALGLWALGSVSRRARGGTLVGERGVRPSRGVATKKGETTWGRLRVRMNDGVRDARAGGGGGRRTGDSANRRLGDSANRRTGDSATGGLLDYSSR